MTAELEKKLGALYSTTYPGGWDSKTLVVPFKTDLSYKELRVEQSNLLAGTVSYTLNESTNEGHMTYVRSGYEQDRDIVTLHAGLETFTLDIRFPYVRIDDASKLLIAGANSTGDIVLQYGGGSGELAKFVEEKLSPALASSYTATDMLTKDIAGVTVTKATKKANTLFYKGIDVDGNKITLQYNKKETSSIINDADVLTIKLDKAEVKIPITLKY